MSPSRVARPLRIRLGIFLAIGVVIIGIIVRDVIASELSWWLASIAVLVGLGIGYALGRVGNVKWHETEEQVVSQVDAIGIIAIVVYIALRVGSPWLFGHWLSGVALSTFTLAVLGGALVGRFLGARQSIKKVLDRPR